MTNGDTEKRLWDVANDLRANSGLGPAEYSHPVLGLIFLRHADFNFTKKENELKATKSNSRRKVGKLDYQADGVVFLPEYSRFEYLLNLPESANIGESIDNAMQLIENENSELKDILPRGYAKFTNDLLVTLLKAFSKISTDSEGDVFGKIYEYFLGKFAMSEGQKGGEFFTPTSIVKLVVEIIEPFHGKILDPACGSGGMFVQSARFIQEHKKNPSEELSIYGSEKTFATVKLCKMNLAVHGLSGDIKETNSYYEDVHKSVGKFDFVMANPPFNVKKVDFEKVKGDSRCNLGSLSTGNANYLWIQFFHSALNDTGRAGFVMANTASDAQGNELEIRKKLILSKTTDVIVAVNRNFFYTVTLPCTLWFFDKNKMNTDRNDSVLFIDARNTFNQVDRAHREFATEHISQISDIVRRYRKEKDTLPYKNIPGLCKTVTFKEIEAEGWNLNPGRYVKAKKQKKLENFGQNLKELNSELESLKKESTNIESDISKNISNILLKLDEHE